MTVLRVDSEDNGVRLDRYLRQRLPHTSLSQVFRMIRTGAVRRNGKRAHNGDRLCAGDEIQVRVASADVVTPGSSPNALLEQLPDSAFFRRSFVVLLEDNELLACNKPSGLVVHPGSGHEMHDTLIGLATAHLRRCGGAERQPYLVHRIDRDTSGIVLLAKDRAALRALHESLRRGEFVKRYVALCHGAPPRAAGQVETVLERTYERNDGTKMRVGDDGQVARSSYRVVRRTGGLSLVEVTLDTGRTHQIRVQMAHLGCPVVGDVRYGDADRDRRLFEQRPAEKRLYLHAGALSFPHPAGGTLVSLRAEPPACFAALSTPALPARRSA